VYPIALLITAAIVIILPCQVRFLEYARNNRQFPGWHDIAWKPRSNQRPGETPDWVYFAFALVLIALALASILLQNKIVHQGGEIAYIAESQKMLLKLLLLVLALASFSVRYAVYFVSGGEQKMNFWFTAISVYPATGFIVGKRFSVRWFLAAMEFNFFLLVAIYFNYFR